MEAADLQADNEEEIMIPTIPMTELTDTELDAVSGGLQLSITSPQINVTPQINVGAPTAVAVAALGGVAAIQQALVQANGA
jgi:bacteriocin-like protein